MKTKHLLQTAAFAVVSAFSLQPSALVYASPLGTAFTYQGKLTAGGQPASGIYDFLFTLHGDASVSNVVAAPILSSGVGVTNGLFTVTLDFGANVFTGDARWLEILVCTNGGAFTMLAPRQPLTPTPYALYSPSAGSAGTATTAGTASSVAPGSIGTAALASSAVTSANIAASAVGATQLDANAVQTGNIAAGAVTAAKLDPTIGIWTQSGTNLAYTAGNVGIGTTNPQSPLDVNGGGRMLELDLQNTWGHLAFNAHWDAGSSEWRRHWDGPASLMQQNGSDGGLNWLVNGGGSAGEVVSWNYALRLAPNGNLGIGTNNPQSALHVNGAVTAETFQGKGAVPWQEVTNTSLQAEPNKGYVVTNASQVTITLPASPAVGDIVRVSAPGAGGWTIAQNPGQAIRLGHLTTTLSRGVTWTARESSRDWKAVASSADGTKLVAVVRGGQIYISKDSGVTWTARAGIENWQSVASSEDGIKLVAVVDNGLIYTSTNSGSTWPVHAFSANWSSVASSADGTKLVAVGVNDQIWTSTDSGVNWTARESPRSWQSVASSSDGTKLVAAGPQIYTSTNSGVTWTARESPQLQAVASSSDGTKLVAVRFGGQIYTSTDSGVTWTARESSRDWQAVASSADGTKLVAVVPGRQIYVSADSGVTWIARTIYRNWQSVASSSDGTKLVAVVGDGQIYTSAATPVTLGSTTTPGSTGHLDGEEGTAIELQYIGNNLFLPLSHEGDLFAY